MAAGCFEFIAGEKSMQTLAATILGAEFAWLWIIRNHSCADAR
jgi:hypothetical protein